MTNKLPEFYEKYFEEKFKNVLDEIQGVKVDVKAVKGDIAELKKTVSGLEAIKPIVKKNEAKMTKLGIAVAIVAIALLVHTLTMSSDSSFVGKIIPLLL